MFQTSTQAKPVVMLPGVTRRTLTYGDRMLLVEFTIQAGSVFPEHSHPYEQIGYLSKGSGTLQISGESYDLSPGSSWCIPADVLHRAQFSKKSVAIDVFSPVREDYRDR